MINHVAIIMDGNGRWASERKLPKIEGHRRGAKVAKDIIKHAASIGVKHLTLYAFSVENWRRPAKEVNDIFEILSFYLDGQINELHQNNICFKVIGDRQRLSTEVVSLIGEAELLTKNNNAMTLYLAVSYGGRDEIVRAFNNALAAGVSKITEDELSNYMDAPSMPNVDLMIRASGERRVSNFLIWQSFYSELYFTDEFWPDFTKESFDKALADFARRKRNFGYTREQQE